VIIKNVITPYITHVALKYHASDKNSQIAFAENCRPTRQRPNAWHWWQVASAVKDNKKSELMLMRCATTSVQFHTQVV